MFEYLQAIKLLGINEGWQWTLDTFLAQHLKNALDEYTRLATTSMKANQLLAFFLILQGHLISHLCPKKHMTTQALEAIKSYGLLLKSPQDTKEALIVECAVVESLVLMMPFDPVECVSQIQSWISLYKNKYKHAAKLPKSVEFNIEYVFNFYKEKLPSNLIITF